MLKKIGGLIKRHKILFGFCLIGFILVIVMLVMFLKITINTSGNYGNRLEGIEDVEISKTTLSEISDFLEEKDEVSEAKLRIQGKIIYVNVSFTDKINMAKGKEIAATVFEKFSSEELKFYDFSFLINQTSENEEAELWSSAGSKNTEEVKISWAKS